MGCGCDIYAVNYLIVTFKVRATACLGQEKPKIRTDYELAMSGENVFAPNHPRVEESPEKSQSMKRQMNRANTVNV